MNWGYCSPELQVNSNKMGTYRIKENYFEYRKKEKSLDSDSDYDNSDCHDGDYLAGEIAEAYNPFQSNGRCTGCREGVYL